MKIKVACFLTVFQFFVLYPLTFAQCSFSLGNDTTFCTNLSVLNFTLNGPPAHDLYVWNTGATTPSITVDTNGIYFCTASLLAGDLIYNGNFSIGDTGFVTNYTDSTGGDVFSTGTYAITTDPILVHGLFMSFGDHTSGTGNMMVCNGGEIADDTVWKQTITVVPGTDYNFSAWATSVQDLSSTTDAAQLQFSINGILLGSVYSLSAVGGSWTNFYENWNSGAATSAVIAIVDQDTAEGSNDFALDDIFFQTICSYTDSIFIRGNRFPDVDAGPSGLIPCRETTVTLNGSSTTPGVLYSWSGPEIVSGGSCLMPVVSAAGNYKLIVTEPVEGCQSMDSVDVIVHTLPVISFTTDTTQGCDPAAISFSAIVSQPGGTCSWYFGDETSSEDTAYGSNVTHTYTHPASYSVSLTYTTTSDCISDSMAPDLISIHANPVAAYETTELTNTLTPTINFQDESEASITNWFWDFGIYGTSDLQNPVIVYSSPGTYEVPLIVTNAFGCKSSVSHDIIITDRYSFYAPDAFTPNGDGLNDEFIVKGGGIDPATFEMKIFNRWGELVFHSQEIDKGWNGTMNNIGPTLKEDEYVWKVDFVNYSGAAHTYMGHVMLLTQ